MVYSRIVDVNATLVCDTLNDGNLSLEPGKLLEVLPREMTHGEWPLYVLVSDGTDSVEYDMSTFLSRSYRVVGKKVRFGSKKLVLSKLSISIGFKILLEDLSPITDTRLD
jgi:hypothetical protein